MVRQPWELWTRRVSRQWSDCHGNCGREGCHVNGPTAMGTVDEKGVTSMVRLPWELWTRRVSRQWSDCHGNCGREGCHVNGPTAHSIVRWLIGPNTHWSMGVFRGGGGQREGVGATPPTPHLATNNKFIFTRIDAACHSTTPQ